MCPPVSDGARRLWGPASGGPFDLKLDSADYCGREIGVNSSDRSAKNVFMHEHVDALVSTSSGLATQCNTCRIDLLSWDIMRRF